MKRETKTHPTLRQHTLSPIWMACTLAGIFDRRRSTHCGSCSPRAGGTAPAVWADVVAVRVGWGFQGRVVTPSVRWTSPPNTTMVLSDLGENMELRVYMRQESINTKVQARLVALRELQSRKGWDCPRCQRVLQPPVNFANRASSSNSGGYNSCTDKRPESEAGRLLQHTIQERGHVQ